MSKITGVPDFKDFIDQYGISYVKKLNIYVGYYNYIRGNSLDTSKYDSIQDWAYLFHYCILTKSLYKALGSGYIVLYDRDYFSLQDDLAAWNGWNKKSDKGRKRFAEVLRDMKLSEKEIGRTIRYRYELESKQSENIEEGDTK